MQKTRQDRLPGLYLIVVQGKHFVKKKIVWPYKEKGGVGEELYVRSLTLCGMTLRNNN